MKVFRPLKKGFDKAVKLLTKVYGVEADIYFPISINNVKHGVRDNDITYATEPDLSRKVLIPYIFKLNDEAELFSVDFENDGRFLFIESTVKIPDYSKIILRKAKLDIQNFQVHRFKGIDDDEQTIYGKYELVPLTAIDIEANRDEFINDLEEQLSDEFMNIPDNLLDMDGSKLEDKGTLYEERDKISSDRIYSPIGG